MPYKPSAYTGTTGCSLHKRLTEHHDATVRNDQKNALAKHLARYHPGVTPSNLTFSASIIDRQKYNLQRYISESLQIEKLTKIPEMKVMNSKGEWGPKDSSVNVYYCLLICLLVVYFVHCLFVFCL